MNLFEGKVVFVTNSDSTDVYVCFDGWCVALIRGIFGNFPFVEALVHGRPWFVTSTPHPASPHLTCVPLLRISSSSTSWCPCSRYFCTPGNGGYRRRKKERRKKTILYLKDDDGVRLMITPTVPPLLFCLLLFVWFFFGGESCIFYLTYLEWDYLPWETWVAFRWESELRQR